MRHLSPRVTAFLHTALLSISLIAGTLLLVTSMQNASGNYLSGGAFIALCIIIAVTATASCVVSLLANKRNEIGSDEGNDPGHAGAFLLGILFVVMSCVLFGINIAYAIQYPHVLTARLTLIAASVFLLFGGLFPLFALGKKPNPVGGCLTGISLTLACLFFPLHLYFDTLAPKNASLKLLLSLALLFAALFFLSEVRRILGRNIPVFYRIARPIAAHLAAMLAVAPIAFAFAVKAPPIGGYVPYLFLCLFFLYIIIGILLPDLGFGDADDFVPAQETDALLYDTQSEVPPSPRADEIPVVHIDAPAAILSLYEEDATAETETQEAPPIQENSPTSAEEITQETPSDDTNGTANTETETGDNA